MRTNRTLRPVPSLAPRDPWFTWARKVVHGGDLPLEKLAAIVACAPASRGRREATAALRLMVEGHRLRREGAHRDATRALQAGGRKLLPLARRDVPPMAWLLAWCRLWQAHTDYTRGAFAEALRQYGEVLSLMENAGDVHGLAAVHRGLGNVAKYLGLYAEAAEHYEDSIRLAERAKAPICRAMAEHNLGNVHLALEDHPAAEAAYRKAAIGLARTGRRDLLMLAWVSLADVARARKDLPEALRRLARAEKIGRRDPVNPGFEAERLISLGTCQRELGHASLARPAFERAVALATSVSERHIAALARQALAETALETGAPAEALAVAQRALEDCQAAGTTTEVCGALHELAARAARECGDWPAAGHHFDQALQERKRLSAHLAQVRSKTIALHHELNRARHDAELARVEKARLEEALARIAARLRAAPPGRHVVSMEETDADALTPLGISRRESEVLLWLLRGKTNAEIALILGCGAETVKTHLKRIFQRLDVTNRAAAITRAVAFVAGERGP